MHILPNGFMALSLCCGLLPYLSCSSTSSPHHSGDTGSVTWKQGDIDDGSSDEQTDVALPWPDGKYITPTEVYDRLLDGDSDMLPLNVVDEQFYSLGHIQGSLIIPWDELEANLDAVDAERHIVVYCRRGVRSETGYAILIEHGYESVWVMSGGLEQWIELGYPVVH